VFDVQCIATNCGLGCRHALDVPKRVAPWNWPHQWLCCIWPTAINKHMHLWAFKFCGSGADVLKLLELPTFEQDTNCWGTDSKSLFHHYRNITVVVGLILHFILHFSGQPKADQSCSETNQGQNIGIILGNQIRGRLEVRGNSEADFTVFVLASRRSAFDPCAKASFILPCPLSTVSSQRWSTED